VTYKYEFTEANPPLMKATKGPPTEIPASDLVKLIGTATWTKEEVIHGVSAFNDETTGMRPKPLTKTTTYNVTRTKAWALADAPHHYAQDVTRKVTVVEGYSKSEKVTFAKTVDGSIGGKLFGFDALVKETLQLTDETEEQRKEETTEETETTFKAGHWYASWTLLDILDAKKHIHYDWGGVPDTEG
jgi:hypothetical protein